MAMDTYQRSVTLEEGPKRIFSEVFANQNQIAQTAIKSLDELNEQIVQYVFAPLTNGEQETIPTIESYEDKALHGSMVLIRELLTDAQSKFRNMVDDNKQLANRIDGTIQAANQEVSSLRDELADTNKRLTIVTSEISSNFDKVERSTQCEEDSCTCLVSSKQKIDDENEAVQLREENSRLEQQFKSLSKEVEDLRRFKEKENNQHPSYGDLKLEIIQRRQELNRAKEALQAMKADRKRLKAEKLDLLNQMKQLYGTLEDKEAELRDFIRSYEQRMRESDESIKQLATEKEESEREKWEIIKRARDASERSVYLGAQLEGKDQLIKKLEAEITELREQLCKRNSWNKPASSPILNTPPSLDLTTPSEELPPYETPPPSASFESKELSFSVPSITPEKQDTLTPMFNSLSQELIDMDYKKKRKKSLNRSINISLTRMFSRSRSRRSIALTESQEISYPESSPNPRSSLLNQDNYQEKLQIVDQAKGVHISKWKANLVLSWLEIVLSMPMYGQMCSENIKSGKILLGLSDSELSSALGITNPIHRKKLRLAIEEQRDPADIKYPKACLMDHTWVAHKWISDIGLPQYKTLFEDNLIDARILNTLSRKDLEKYLEIHRKFHHASILHAVELLRRLDFDKENLISRRSQCEKDDCDLLVWTNQRVIRWIDDIDLEEYSKNLKESGVHGALMVLESSFNAETLATALGIPPTKSYVRRHLATELDALLKPARKYAKEAEIARRASLDATLEAKRRVRNGGSVGRSFSRSYRSSAITEDENSNEQCKSRFSLRGSIGKAFGLKMKEDLKMEGDSPKRKISAPLSVTHNKFYCPVITDQSSTAV